MPEAQRHLLILTIVFLLTTGVSVRADLSSTVKIVWKKDPHQTSTDLYVRLGDTVRLVNGDENVVHHAFIEADRFSFDAGDQEPGAEAKLTFTESGDFVIQCGIHPKMKLTLHVR